MYNPWCMRPTRHISVGQFHFESGRVIRLWLRCALHRTPEYLAQSIEDARKEGYSIGVKLVRGAYHPHEVAAHPSAKAGAHSLSISPDAEPPVWTTKEDTDARYNACVRTLVGAVKADVEASKGARPPTIGVLFGTHNWESADLIPEELIRQGAASKDEDGTIVVGADVAERVTMGQLFGASRIESFLMKKLKTDGHDRDDCGADELPRRPHPLPLALRHQVHPVRRAVRGACPPPPGR